MYTGFPIHHRLCISYVIRVLTMKTIPNGKFVMHISVRIYEYLYLN